MSNVQIERHEPCLNVSGKQIPNIGGGWNCSRYNENVFVKKSRCVGICFEHQNGGHNKAFISEHNISDSLTISLHNPSCHAAKDIVRYAAKYNIIKLGYYVSNLSFVQNKNFLFHQNYLFQKNDDLQNEKIKNKNFYIDRKFVISYIKEMFIKTDKINFQFLIKNAIKELKNEVVKI